MISLHKTMVETQADAHHVLTKAVDFTAKELTELHATFELAKHNLKRRIDEDIATSTNTARTYLEKLASSLGSALDTMARKIKSTTENVEQKSALIREASYPGRSLGVLLSKTES